MDGGFLNFSCGDYIFWKSELCRRYPPQLVPYPNGSDGHFVYMPIETFPSRNAYNDACGEFQYRASK